MNAILMTYVVNGQIVNAAVEPCPAAPPTPTISENFGTLSCPVDPVSGVAIPPEGSAIEFVIEQNGAEVFRAVGSPSNSYVDMPNLLPPGNYRIRSRFVSKNFLTFSQPSPWLDVTVPEPEA